MTNPSRKQKIVIVGGGAGGLELAAGFAKKYRNKSCEITLVDASPIHFWKPLLHEVAAGTLNSFEDEINYLAFASQWHFRFCLGSMESIHREKKEIVLAPLYNEAGQELVPKHTLSYDVLVMAVGSVSNDFNIPGVREHCLFIDNSEQASHFQQVLLQTMLQLPYAKKALNIAIVGGGATGVELAAELHYAVRQMASYGMQFDPEKVSFTLIEAAPRILPALSEHLSEMVTTALTTLNVKIYTGEQVSEVTAAGLTTKTGKFIPADIKTWAAGIKAPEFLKNLDGLEVNKINQLVVTPSLQTTQDPSIFALGDCAYCLQGNGKPVPPRAQAAHQQASFLIKAIDKYLTNKTLPSYRYHDYGSLISLSHYETIGNLMGRITKSMLIEGKLARFFYLSLYRLHQIALYGYWRVTNLMIANFLTRRIRPRLKLH